MSVLSGTYTTAYHHSGCVAWSNRKKAMRISVIIPTLNEADYIEKTLNAVFSGAVLDELPEIIVVDSGSTDNTLDVVKKFDIRIDRALGQRGKKYAVMNRGGELATSEVLFFLDADTIPPHGYDRFISDAFANPKIIGGAFEFKLEGRGLTLRIVELINRIRYRIRNRFYGDQGIFVLKTVFDHAGGYPERSIMEAAYLCSKLKKHGKLRLIHKNMITSSRRFLNGGALKVFFFHIKIVLLDLLGKNVDQYGSGYWEENNRRGSPANKPVY
jgi:glycosyltransferase involved in cell wall biosynthesis